MTKRNKTDIGGLEDRISILEEAIAKLSKAKKPAKETTKKKDK
jgi:uncharacterized small protein (DUF1192 family)